LAWEITLPDGRVPIRWRATWIEENDDGTETSVEGAVVLRSDGVVFARAERRDGVKCREPFTFVGNFQATPAAERRARVLARLRERGYALSS